jgi:hypothetical protein
MIYIGLWLKVLNTFPCLYPFGTFVVIDDEHCQFMDIASPFSFPLNARFKLQMSYNLIINAIY